MTSEAFVDGADEARKSSGTWDDFVDHVVSIQTNDRWFRSVRTTWRGSELFKLVKDEMRQHSDDDSSGDDVIAGDGSSVVDDVDRKRVVQGSADVRKLSIGEATQEASRERVGDGQIAFQSFADVVDAAAFREKAAKFRPTLSVRSPSQQREQHQLTEAIDNRERRKSVLPDEPQEPTINLWASSRHERSRLYGQYVNGRSTWADGLSANGKEQLRALQAVKQSMKLMAR